MIAALVFQKCLYSVELLLYFHMGEYTCMYIYV